MNQTELSAQEYLAKEEERVRKAQGKTDVVVKKYLKIFLVIALVVSLALSVVYFLLYCNTQEKSIQKLKNNPKTKEATITLAEATYAEDKPFVIVYLALGTVLGVACGASVINSFHDSDKAKLLRNVLLLSLLGLWILLNTLNQFAPFATVYYIMLLPLVISTVPALVLGLMLRKKRAAFFAE